mgnify:FL=1
MWENIANLSEQSSAPPFRPGVIVSPSHSGVWLAFWTKNMNDVRRGESGYPLSFVQTVTMSASRRLGDQCGHHLKMLSGRVTSRGPTYHGGCYYELGGREEEEKSGP